MREHVLRGLVAKRLEYGGNALAAAGILAVHQLRLMTELRNSPRLEVHQTRWIRYLGKKAEIDIVVPAAQLAVECKVRRGLGRLNWEEALGQALRDLQVPWIRHAYVAVPISDADEWLLSTALAVEVGVIGVESISRNQPSWRAVKFLFHPEGEW